MIHTTCFVSYNHDDSLTSFTTNISYNTLCYPSCNLFDYCLNLLLICFTELEFENSHYETQEILSENGVIAVITVM